MKNSEYNESFCENVKDMPIENECVHVQVYGDEKQTKQYGAHGAEIHDNNFAEIYGVLKCAYDDCDIENENLLQFAEQLNEYIFVEKYRLNEIICLACDFEEEMRENGKTIDIGRQCFIFDSIIDRLEINEENAKRLFESFLEFRDCNTFWRLMDYYTQWLTEEQKYEVLSIAKGEFDKFVWNDYV